MSFAFVFPGQGSQSVGMLADFAEVDEVREAFREASAALGYDLWELIQEGPAERLNGTEYQQPAMLTAGAALWRLWKARGGADPGEVRASSRRWCARGRCPSAPRRTWSGSGAR